MEIKSTSDVEDQGIKVLVHGQAGSGKTYMASTVPNLNDVLIISAEQGLLSLHQYDIDAVEVTSIGEFREVRDFAKDQNRYSWIILDSVSEIAEVILGEEKEGVRDPRKAYGEMAEQVTSILREFRYLPCNVVMTAKQAIESVNGVQVKRPLLPGNTLDENIPHMFDEVFALEVDRANDGQVERYLQTQKTRQVLAKDRSGALDTQEPADLSVIYDKITGEVGGEAQAPGDPMQTSDEATRQLTDRIRNLLDEVYDDVGSIERAFELYVCDWHGVNTWRQLSKDELMRVGKMIANWSIKGGRLSTRRHEIDEWICDCDGYEPESPVDWSATATSDDTDRASLRKRWHATAQEKLDDIEPIREALKGAHYAVSFKDLTSSRIMENLDKLERLEGNELDKWLDTFVSTHGPDQTTDDDSDDLTRLERTVGEWVDPDVRDTFCQFVLAQSNVDSVGALPEGAVDQWVDTIEGKDDPAGWVRSKVTDAAAE